MVGKAFQQVFYLSMATSVVTHVMRSCRGVPIHHEANPRYGPRAPDHSHYMVVFHVDHLGSFKKAPGGLTHLLVTVNKFTKWIKARPLAKIGSKQAINFVQDIIFCFGVQNSIITDNGTQFTREKFLDFCDDNNI
jgi:hypothetical protein